MALHSRYKSAPQLQKVDDVTYMIVDPTTMSDDDNLEFTEDDGEFSEMDDGKSIKSASGDSVRNMLLSPEGQAYMSESDVSPILRRKNRRAPLPPDMSPTMAARHSHAFDLNALRLRSSTDTESSNDSRLFYQTSTDSESVVMPESARGSNFPGELAGLENLHVLSALRPNSADATLIQSPQGRPKLHHRLRDVFLSPQIRRRKTMKEKSSTEKTPRIRKIKLDDGTIIRTKTSKVEESSRFKMKKVLNSEPLPEMSDWILIGGLEDIVGDQEIEVKRIPDYENFLSALLDSTSPSHVDYEDICRSLNRVRSIMKETDDESRQESDADGVRTRRASADEISSGTDNSTDPNTDNTSTSITDSSPNINTDSTTTSSVDNAANSNTTSGTYSATDNSTNNNIDKAINIVIDNSDITNHNSSNVSNNNNNEDVEKQVAKTKGLSLRRRSAPSAVLFKALSHSRSKGHNSSWYNTSPSKRDQDVISQFKLTSGDSSRMFIAEGSVQFAAGMQIQDRYLFLFSDLLLVTKQKSNTTFKLKNKVHLCDMWIASCIEEVCETTRPADRSFVLGWPITNVVATFPTAEVKDGWLSHLRSHITKEKLKEEDKSITLQVSLKDIESTTSRHCQMTINNFTQVKDVVLDCLKQINISESDAKDYQLWGLAGKEGSPYPLIGHETPYSIKLSQVRELPRSRSGNDLDNTTPEYMDSVLDLSSPNGQKCEFYLQQKKPPRKNRFEDASLQKQMKKSKKSPNFLNAIFRKKRPAQPQIFGQSLADICDENFDPPEAIIKLMVLVYQQGPHTPGILRRGNNAALGREIREKIDSGDKYMLEEHMAPTAASVFKEFLRLLPDGLLVCSLHEQWLTIKKDDPYEEKINKIKTILTKLPPVNYHILKLTICLLQHLAKHCGENRMNPSNLATCIAPSLYSHVPTEHAHGKYKGDTQKQMQESLSEIHGVIVPLVSFMITHHVELFGEDILNMFVKYDCQASPAHAIDDERYDSHMQPSAEEEDNYMVEEEEDDDFNSQDSPKQRRLQLQKPDGHTLRESNSGTDSDSMHSVLSMQDAGMSLQRDDSSIDSLGERDYYAHESPKAVKSHLSPSNLSRDSGLTLSDNQLYDEEAYPAEIASASLKMFQQRDPYTHGLYSLTRDVHDHDKTVIPVAPPRTRSVRKRTPNTVGSDGGQNSYIDSSFQHTPLTHSASTTHLDDSNDIGQHRDYRPLIAHSSLDKRVSADSTEELKDNNQPQAFDFLKMKERTDIGTLVKSGSSVHLFLNEETFAAQNSLGISENETHQNFLRQSSATSSSVPLSPESRHSQSSCDSVISDSTYSISRDGSVNSAPLTPDEPDETSLNWVPDISLPGKPWQGLINQRFSSYSKASDNLSKKEESYDDTLTSDNSLDVSPKKWSGKSHEVEEVGITDRPPGNPMDKPKMSDFSIDTSSHTSQAFPGYNTSYGKQRFTSDAGCTPPIVSYHAASRSDFVPFSPAFISAQKRRSSVDSFEPKHSNMSADMQSIRPEEYIIATSKPIIISPESSSSNLASSATTRAKLSKYITPRKELSLSYKDSGFVLPQSKGQPLLSPNYHQMIKRNVIMKCDIPDDITETQRQSSARAKAMYEQSLQLYNKENHDRSSERSLNLQFCARSQPNLPSSNLAYVEDTQSEIDDTMPKSLASNKYADNTHDYASNCSFQSAVSSDNPDDCGASGFLDMRPVSYSLQEDVVSRRNTLADNDPSSVRRSISAGNLVSLSRSGSKLSDSGSSCSSSVTISTLSKHSDSFGRRSDLSNVSSVTVSSVSSSDSNPEMTSKAPRQRSLTRVEQRSISPTEFSSRTRSRTYEHMTDNTDDVDVYSTLTRDPEEVYLQSRQIYEQNSGTPSSILPKSNTSPSSCSHHPQQQPSGNMSQSPSQTTVSLPKEINTRGRPTESRARLNLEVPGFNLQRSRSDSAEHAHKHGAYSPHSAKTAPDDSGNSQDMMEQSSYEDAKIRTLPRDIKTELRQNFLKAKSCFHQPGVSEPTTATSHSPARPVHRSITSLDSTRSRNWPQTASSAVVTADTTVETVLPPVQRPNVPYSSPAGSTSQVNKEFPWSVKDLKSKYNKDTGGSGDSNFSRPTSQISQSRPQNPPPFRHSTSPRHSMSGIDNTDQVSGNKTTPKTFTSQRQGPQGYSCNKTYSSSEDSCGSPPDRKSTWLSNSSLDSEELSDYTNTTYI